MTKPRHQTSMVGRNAGRALARLVRLIERTSSLTVEPPDLRERSLAVAPFILTFWHGQFMLLPLMKQPGDKVAIMVARHGDAAVIAETLAAFDMELIRGAGAGGRKRDRGGSHALRSSISYLEAGYIVGMTADVPPGPAKQAGPGVVALARLSGRPIIPVAIASSRFKVFATWSRMTLNLPFSKLALVAGDPIHVGADASDDELEGHRLAVENALARVTARAYEIAGADPSRIGPEAVPQGGFALNAYRLVTRLLTPAAPAILAYRANRGKEDASRRGERLGIASNARPAGPLIWLHAASVGETNAVLPLITEIGRRRPDLAILLTTGTVTSARIARERLPLRVIHQFVPLDAPVYVRRFLRHWSPQLAVFVESEVWPNLVLEAAADGIPLALVNARISKKSFEGWQRRKSMAQQVFRCFRLVLAQSEQLGKRFARLGARDVRAVGNLKMDAPAQPIDQAERTRLVAAIGGRRTVLAASTHHGEEEQIAEACRVVRRSCPDVLFIIVPRHPERGPAIAERLRQLGLSLTERSRGELPTASDEIYVADTLGELGLFYSIAPIAFIGGSLVPHGGQNPIEAVKLGSVVLTGPHQHNFKDTYDELIRADAACTVASPGALAAAIDELFADPGRLQAMHQRASKAVDRLSGALERTLVAIEELLPLPAELDRAS